MDSNDVNRRKQVLVVVLAALMVAPVFGIIGAAGASRDVTNAAYFKSGFAHSYEAMGSPVIHVTNDAGTSKPGQCLLRIENASMISPSELGVWVSVTYPESDNANVPRYVAFAATINGKSVEKTFNVTSYTTPSVRWGKTSGVENEMFDAKGGIKPTTPLRINLATEGVPRFTDNVKFTLTGTAFAGDGECRSEPSSMPVTIPLPVVIIQGNPGPRTNPDMISAPAYYLFYKSLTDFMLNAGNGTFKYNAEANWNSYVSELRGRNYSTQQYVTLWDPRANFFSQPNIGYIDPQFYAPDAIKTDKDLTRGQIDTTSLKADMEEIIRDYAEPSSYANKVNLVSFSFGGLVVRWFASLDPQYVNTVITVATAHAGDALFYEVVDNDMHFCPLGFRYVVRSAISAPGSYTVVSNRQDAEHMFAVPNTTTPSILYWLVPTYNCLVPPKDQPMSPFFNNTLNAPPASGVKYYNIYIDGEQSYKTDDQVYIQYVKEKNATSTFDWYRVTNVTQGDGDGIILARSAASFGYQYPTQVTNQPVYVKCYHPYILYNPLVQALIYRDLQM